MLQQGHVAPPRAVCLSIDNWHGYLVMNFLWPPPVVFPSHLQPNVPCCQIGAQHMPMESTFTAQLIMKRSDGRSILDLQGPITATSPERTAGDLPPERIEMIRRLLNEAGFTVLSSNSNTLSIKGSSKAFLEVFGLDTSAKASDAPRRGLRIRDDLRPFVADVFIPPAPKLFP